MTGGALGVQKPSGGFVPPSSDQREERTGGIENVDESDSEITSEEGENAITQRELTELFDEYQISESELEEILLDVDKGDMIIAYDEAHQMRQIKSFTSKNTGENIEYLNLVKPVNPAVPTPAEVRKFSLTIAIVSALLLLSGGFASVSGLISPISTAIGGFVLISVSVFFAHLTRNFSHE
jgi:hypothetical protein